MVSPAYEQLQQVRGYYSFPKTLDVDRYTIDGTETDAVVAVREMDLAGVEGKNWNNLRTVYTHGYGLVAAYGNRRQSGGEPDWIAKDIPPTGKIGGAGATDLLRRGAQRLLDRRRAGRHANRSSSTHPAVGRVATRRPSPTAARAGCRSAACSTGCCTPPSSPT